MTSNDDAAIARQERLRTILHRMKGVEEIVAKIPHIGVRDAIRAAEAREIDHAMRLDLARDDHFKRLILGIRQKLNTRSDYEDALRRLSFILDMAMQGTVPGHAPRPAPAPHPDGHSDVVQARTGAAAGPMETGDVVVSEPSPPAMVRADERPATQTAPHLFAGRTHAEIAFLPALLPPAPPLGAPSRALSAWLNGEPWSARALGMAFDAAGAETLLAELEVELRNDPATFFLTAGMKPRFDPTSFLGYGDWLHEEARIAAARLQPDHRAQLASALEAVIDRLYPQQSAALAALHARPVPGDALGPCIAFALDLEHAFLDEADAEEGSRPPQNLLGSIRPDRALRQGLVLEAALTRHFLSGCSLDAALTVGLLELRQAQVARLTDDAEQSTMDPSFDNLFFSDCRRALTSFIMVPDLTPEP